jgi:uncharacterized protein YukE
MGRGDGCHGPPPRAPRPARPDDHGRVNLESAALLPSSPPELLQARAALAAQLVGLGMALARLERARALVPDARPGAEWRGAAQAAYRAGVGELSRQLDEAVDAVRAARRATSRALTTLAAHD